MMYRTISAAKVFEGIEKQKQEAEQKAAEAAENAEANDKMRKSAALLLEDANKIASAFEFDDCDKLVQRYEELNKRLLENEDLTKDEREELCKLKSPYEAILKLRDNEQDAQKKAAEQAKKEAEDRRKEEEKQQREAETRAETGDELKRQAYESEDWNRSFDTLSRLLERLNSSDLSQAEKDSIYQTEFSKMMEAAQQAAVKSSKDAFEAGNLHSVKDFEFTNYEVDDKMLKTQQEMLKASEAAINYQKEIRDRLPI